MAVEIDAGPMPEVSWQSACPACSAPDESTSAWVTDRYGWLWKCCTCLACDVQYQRAPMTDAARREFYGSGRYRRLCAAVTGKPWDDPAYLRKEQEAYAEQWADVDRLNLPRVANAMWLDYGGSTGVVSQTLSQYFDPTTTITVADYGDGATTTPEQALAVPEGTYDAILCCQTLDHLREPLQTLRDFRRVAKPGARLFVDVVKLECTKYKLSHDTYYPTAASFLGLVERSGWEVLWLDAETHPSHYSVLAVRP